MLSTVSKIRRAPSLSLVISMSRWNQIPNVEPDTKLGLAFNPYYIECIYMNQAQQILEALILWVSNTKNLLDEARLIKKDFLKYPKTSKRWVDVPETVLWDYQGKKLLNKAIKEVNKTLDVNDQIYGQDRPSVVEFLKAIPDAECEDTESINKFNREVKFEKDMVDMDLQE